MSHPLRCFSWFFLKLFPCTCFQDNLFDVQDINIVDIIEVFLVFLRRLWSPLLDSLRVFLDLPRYIPIFDLCVLLFLEIVVLLRLSYVFCTLLPSDDAVN